MAHKPGDRTSPGSSTPHTVYLPSVVLVLKRRRTSQPNRKLSPGARPPRGAGLRVFSPLIPSRWCRPAAETGPARSDSLPGPSAGWGWAEMLPPPGTQGSSWLHAGYRPPPCLTEKERNLHPDRVQSKRCWRRLWSASVARGTWSRPWSLPRQVPACEPGSHEAREPGGFPRVILVRSLSPRLSPSENYSSTKTPAMTGPGGSQGSRAV